MNQTSLERARQLRKNSTEAEHALWSELRSKRLNGHKFKRQQLLGRYIVDFVCLAAKLIVEADGGQHAEHQDDDRIRDDWLKSQGFRILQFWNNEILSNLEGVMQVICDHLPPSPQPSPTRGEGA